MNSLMIFALIFSKSTRVKSLMLMQRCETMCFVNIANNFSIKQISALTEITAAFQRLTCLSEDNYDTLASNTTQYSAKLLKKSDQCLAILKCTHLFYCPALVNKNSNELIHFLIVEKPKQSHGVLQKGAQTC